MWSDLAVPWVAGPPFPSVFKKTEEKTDHARRR